MKRKLAKLKKVELREVWGHEALDFTKWLAQQENIDLLSEEIGIDIKPIETEANVGRFSVDILAEEEATGRKITIENQLEETNHDHLGKIITYASGYDAKFIICVVKSVREEHKKAVDWLNEHTDEDINFFLIRIELWQVEDSDPAPKFEVVASPNEWARTIKTSSSGSKMTETRIQQLDFWTRFKSHVRELDKGMKLQKPRPQHWYNVSMGSADAHIGLTINTRDNLLGCEVYISKNKELFRFLHDQKKDIEKELGEQANWVDAPVASRIVVKKQVGDIFSEDDANDYFGWLYERTILFRKVFGKFIKDFKNSK